MNRHSHTDRSKIQRSRKPRGFVLVVVLVVLVLLSLGAYSFSEFMLAEADATAMYGRAAQTRAFADSGVEYVSAMLNSRTMANADIFLNNPQAFQGIIVKRDEATPRGQGRFSVVSSTSADPSGRTVRFGLGDDSGKLNLNALAQWNANANSTASPLPQPQVTDTDARTWLMCIPGITMEIADAILDWIDSDTAVRQYGAEDDVYASMNPPYKPHNGPLATLDDLLMVHGITFDLLFGEDVNRNGLLDPNENDGGLTPPNDNSDGVLQRGWSTYLTVYSRETNMSSDGTQRINLNQTTLTDLYNALVTAFDQPTAQYILACCVSNLPAPVMPATTTTTNSSGPSAGAMGTTALGTTSMGTSGSASTSSSSSGASGASSTSGTTAKSNRTTKQSGGGGGGGGGGGSSSGGSSGSSSSANSGTTPTTMIVGGLAVPITATPGTLTSVYTLINASNVQAPPGSSISTGLVDPWANDAPTMQTYLPHLIDKLAFQDGKYYEGRININLASTEVLTGIPGMSATLLQSIIGAQGTPSSSGSGSGGASDHSTTAWLYYQGLTDLPTLNYLDQFITGRGDSFHAQVIGYFDAGGPTTRIEAVFDATHFPPQPIFLRDLSDLGRGIPRSMVNGGR